MAEASQSQSGSAVAQPRKVVDTWMPSTRQRTWWGDVWRRFRSQRISLVALAVLSLLLFSALAAPLIAPHDPIQQFRKEGLSAKGEPLPPTSKFLLGTDSVGRDLLSRLVYGGRVSLSIGVISAVGVMAVALLVGGIAGFAGGKVDFMLMRLVDLMMSTPTFFLFLLLVVVLGPSPLIIVFVIVIFNWPYPSRVFRSQILTVKERDFIEAARSVGVPSGRIFFRHLLPHLLPTVIVYMMLSVPGAIFAEAGLSFIGLGIPGPTPSWGAMIQDGQQFYRAAPWLILYPTLVIMATVVSFNLLGNGLREAMDPARRGR